MLQGWQLKWAMLETPVRVPGMGPMLGWPVTASP